MATKAKIGVLGASGYTGSELVRMLLRHPRAEIVLLTAERSAGQGDARRVSAILAVRRCRQLVSIEGLDWAKAGLDLVFCALPHATTQKVLKELLAQAPATKVVDLSADFRLARYRGLREVVRPRASRAGAAEGGGLRPCRNPPARDQEGAAGRQSRLLHHLRATAADPADQEQGDRARRHRGRRQVRHDRGRAGGQGSHAVLGSVGRLPRLWRRRSPAHGRARSGIFARRRAGGDRQLHPASGADEPGHPVDHLCAGQARPDAGGASRDTFKVLREGAVSCMCCRSARRRRPGMCAAPT